MFQALFGRKTAQSLAHPLYGAVVARARDPLFYTAYGVPDTFDGRFEMLVIHNYLLMRRLKDAGKHARDVSQGIFDLFLNDMDSALREAAVGDVTVPKRIAKMTRVFYGRTGAFDEALDQENAKDALAEVITRNLFTDIESNGSQTLIAGYMVDQVKRLDALSVEQVLACESVFEGSPALPLEQNVQKAGI